MKPILPTWLAGLLLAAVLLLGAYLGGPDEVQAAIDTDLAVQDLHAKAKEQ